MNDVQRVKDPVAKILDCDKDIVIRAGAGTGKTFTLVQKYVHELMRKKDDAYLTVDNLAAITFTEKAAEEMKSKIRDALSTKIEEISRKLEQNGALGDYDLLSTANLDESYFKDSVEDKKLLAHLIGQRQKLAGAYISTIHSFSARLIKEIPVASGVDPSFSIIEEETADELLEECASNTVLKLLRQSDTEVSNLVMAVGFNYDPNSLVGGIVKTMPLLRAAGASPVMLEKELDEYLKTLPQKADVARQKIKGLTPKLLEQKKVTKAHKLGLMLTEPDFLPDSSCSLDDAKRLEGKALWVTPKSNNEGKSHELLGIEAAALLRDIIAPVIERESAKAAKAFLRVADETLQEYGRRKKQNSFLDFDDLQEIALKLLQNNSGVLDSYRENLARIMVDEYQDTNELQYKIITLLAPPGDNRLLVVGDAKQSIYGFRGADYSVFEKTASEIEGKGGGSFTLNISRRSTPPLISYSNSFFATLMADKEKFSVPFIKKRDDLTPHRIDKVNSPAVFRVATGNDDANAKERRLTEALAIGDLIGEITGKGGKTIVTKEGEIRPVRLGDIAILLQNFSNISIYESALRFLGIDYTVVKGRGFFDTLEIRDFANLLSSLDYADDKLAFMSVLRSPFAGLSDNALLAICRDNKGKWRDPHKTIAGDIKKIINLNAVERNKLEFFSVRFKNWRNLKDRLTVAELLEMIIEESGYLAIMTSRLHGEQKLANVLKLIEQARQYEADGRVGLVNFVSFINRAIEGERKENQADISDSEVNSIKIMTVHQSKGLEFGVVILPDISAGDHSQKGIVAFHGHTGLAAKLYDAPTGQWIKGVRFDEVATAEKEARLAEKKRLLYVAMTRARDLLYICGSEENKRRGDWQKWIDETVGLENLPVARVELLASKTGAGGVEKKTPELVTKIMDGYRPKAPPTKKRTKQPKEAPALQMSVTGLSTIRHCQRLYYYQRTMTKPPRFEKRKETTGPALGQRVHSFLERANVTDPTWTKSLPSSVESEFSDLPQEPREKISKNILRTFSMAPLNNIAGVDKNSIFREAAFVTKIVENDFSLTLTGSADIVWSGDDGPCLVDYKYSAKPTDERRYLMQIKLYAFAWMSIHALPNMTASLVYFIEPDEPVSGIRILVNDLPGIRKSALSAAKTLHKRDGKPEESWELRDNGACEDFGCAYRTRCFPNEG